MSQQDATYSRELVTPGGYHRDFWCQPEEEQLLRKMDKHREAIAMRINKQAKGARKSG